MRNNSGLKKLLIIPAALAALAVFSCLPPQKGHNNPMDPEYVAPDTVLLSGISLSGTSISNEFSPSNMEYSAYVANNVTNVGLSVTKSNSYDTVTYKVGSSGFYQEYSSFFAPNIELTEGGFTDIYVNAENRHGVSREYLISVYRAPSNAESTSTLSSFEASCDYNETFNSLTKDYTQTVNATETSITIKASRTSTNSFMHYSINAAVFMPLMDDIESAEIPLDRGVNTLRIRVTAEDASTNTYTLTVTRESLSASDVISIASFNIQDFGDSKSSDADEMAVLARIITNFDLVAIQELSHSSTAGELPMQRLLEAVSNLGTPYSYAYTNAVTGNEQSGYIYKSDFIKVLGGYVYPDPSGSFSRPPFIVQFEATNSEGSFDFSIVSIHTRPDTATSEIMALEDALEHAQEYFNNDDDVIVLGDYNADGSYFSEANSTGFRNSQKYSWIITDDKDTTVAASDNTYDRIVFAKEHTSEDYAGECGVFYFDNVYSSLINSFGGDPDVNDISDHYPVWGKFFIANDTD